MVLSDLRQLYSWTLALPGASRPQQPALVEEEQGEEEEQEHMEDTVSGIVLDPGAGSTLARSRLQSATPSKDRAAREAKGTAADNFDNMQMSFSDEKTQ